MGSGVGSAVGSASIGVQVGDRGRLEERTVAPGKPITVGSTTVSLDANGQLTVAGSDKDDKISIMNGSELGRPGSIVVGVETPGQSPVYLSIPEKQVKGITVDGRGGNDDYWAPVAGNDRFVRLDDTRGNNWVTNLGSRVTGRVSVADDQAAALQRDAGNVELVTSGANGGSPAATATGSFFDSAVSWLKSLWPF